MKLKQVFCVSALAMAGFSVAHAGPWVHNVTGGGEDSYPGYDGDPNFKIEFDARVDANGYAEGDVAWWFLDGTPASFGHVTCLEVRENRAYLVYAAEGGEYPGYGDPGNSVLIAFEDNGQGSGDDPDRQSFIYYANAPLWPCEAWADFVDAGGPGGGFPVEWVHGNVQVR